MNTISRKLDAPPHLPPSMSYAFEPAFRQLTIEQSAEVKAEIMAALAITSRSSWRKRLLGLVEPKLSEAKAIEEIFARRGVAKVWDAQNEQAAERLTDI